MHDPCFSPALRRECFGSCLQSPEKEVASRLGRDTKRAGEGTRTLDIQLGKLALYQLSYARERKNLSRSSDACTRGPRQPLFTVPAVARSVASMVARSVAPPAATAGAGADHVVARHPPAQPRAPPPRRHQLRRDLPVLQAQPQPQAQAQPQAQPQPQAQAQAQAQAPAQHPPAELPAQAAGHWPPPPPHAGRAAGPLLRSAPQPDR